MVGRTYFPPLPRDLAVLLARIIAAVKIIDVPMLTRGHVAIVELFPRDLLVLFAQIIGAMKNIGASMLTRVWQELEYRIDVCRVTRGAHIEHF
jgi:hypothetical protein